MDKENIFQASEFPGETTIENRLKPETPLEIINKLAERFFKVLTFKTINIKNLIVFGALAIIWFVLTLLPHLGYNPLIVKILSFLTFSQGGASNSPIRIFGGLVGKSVFLIFIATFLDGTIKKMHQGIKPFFKGLKQKSKKGFYYLSFGIGIANIIFNFIVGYSAMIRGIIGLAAFMLILIALKSTRGFIYRFVFACIRKYKDVDTKQIEENTNALLSGLGLGFIISMFLTIVPYGYTPYFVGLFFIVISLILVIIDKAMTKKITIVILLILLIPIFSLKISADDGLKGKWVYKKTEYVDNSQKLKEYYKNNEDDKTQMNYEVKKDKIIIEFNYLGEGVNDDLYEDALENPDNYWYIDIVLPNEHFKVTIDVESPKKTYDKNEELKLSFNYNISDKKAYYFEDTAFYASAFGVLFDKEAMDIKDFDSPSSLDFKSFIYFDPFEHEFSPTSTKDKLEYKATTPEPLEKGDVFIIEYAVYFYIDDYYLDPNYSSEDEEDCFVILMYYFYQWEDNIFSASIGGLDEDFPGEEDNITVASVVVTSTLGLFLASLIAGIGALKDDEEADLMFHIKKDFDNILYYNAEEKLLKVKITQQKESQEITRLDIIKTIEVTSKIKGFKIISQEIKDEYKEIKFKLEETKKQEAEGIIIFKYKYDKKIIENKIVFILK